jgi:hypothetical protein
MALVRTIPSVPKRLRWYLEREPKAVSAVLHSFLCVIEAHLRRATDGAASQARLGAVSFIHRFGSSRDCHIHFHCCIIDSVFERVDHGPGVGEAVRFRTAPELTPQARAAICEQVRVPVLGCNLPSQPVRGRQRPVLRPAGAVGFPTPLVN